MGSPASRGAPARLAPGAEMLRGGAGRAASTSSDQRLLSAEVAGSHLLATIVSLNSVHDSSSPTKRNKMR